MDSTKGLGPWELHPKVSSSALAMVLVNLIIGELQNRLGVGEKYACNSGRVIYNGLHHWRYHADVRLYNREAAADARDSRFDRIGWSGLRNAGIDGGR